MAASPLSVVVPLPPSYRGGTEEYAYRLVDRYSRKAPVRVFTTTVRWDASAPCLATGGADCRRLNAFEMFERPLVVSPRERRGLARAVRSSAALQMHMPFPGIEHGVAKAARRAGVPVVLTYHMDADLAGVHPSRSAQMLTRLYRSLSAHPTLELADAIVSNSLGYARASPVLSQHLSKIRVIPKGVDPQRLGLPAPSADAPPPPCVPRSAVRPDTPVLLFVGRLVRYKGLPVLLEAATLLKREGVRFVLLVAGRGPEAEPLRREVARRGLTDVVEFLGFVPDAELGPLYRFADLVVVPSLTPLEATATALEEALACGTPVVGTDLPGTSETVPNDGCHARLVRPGEAPPLADAIRRMLAAGRPESPERFRTWDDVAREYWELFTHLGARFAPVERRGHEEPARERAPSGGVWELPAGGAGEARVTGTAGFWARARSVAKPEANVKWRV